MEKEGEFIVWLQDAAQSDVPLIGGSAKQLAQLYADKAPISPGFVISSSAWQYFLQKNGIEGRFHALVDGLSFDDEEAFQRVRTSALNLLMQAPFPAALEEALVDAYTILGIDHRQSTGSAHGLLKETQAPAMSVVPSFFDAHHDISLESLPFVAVSGQEDITRAVKEAFVDSCFAHALTSGKFDYGSAILQRAPTSDLLVEVSSRSAAKKDCMQVMARSDEGEDSYVLRRDGDETHLLETRLREGAHAPLLTLSLLKRLGLYAFTFEGAWHEPIKLYCSIGGDIVIQHAQPYVLPTVVDEEAPVIEEPEKEEEVTADSEDMESIVLRELDDEYNPSDPDGAKKEIPSLYESGMHLSSLSEDESTVPDF